MNNELTTFPLDRGHTIIILNIMLHHHHSTSLTLTSHTSMRCQASVHASTGRVAAYQLGRQPTLSDTFILRIISFSHHQAVVYSWEFEASLWWLDARHDTNPLRIREEPLGTVNLLIGSWILDTMMLIDSQS